MRIMLNSKRILYLKLGLVNFRVRPKLSTKYITIIIEIEEDPFRIQNANILGLG